MVSRHRPLSLSFGYNYNYQIRTYFVGKFPPLPNINFFCTFYMIIFKLITVQYPISIRYQSAPTRGIYRQSTNIRTQITATKLFTNLISSLAHGDLQCSIIIVRDGGASNDFQHTQQNNNSAPHTLFSFAQPLCFSFYKFYFILLLLLFFLCTNSFAHKFNIRVLKQTYICICTYMQKYSITLLLLLLFYWYTNIFLSFADNNDC